MPDLTKHAEAILRDIEMLLGPVSREVCEVEGDDDYSILRCNILAEITRLTNDMARQVLDAACDAVKALEPDEDFHIEERFGALAQREASAAAIRAIDPTTLKGRGHAA